MTKASPNTARSGTSRVEGEGSYTATRSYNRNLMRAVADGAGIKLGAERARKAVEGPEGAELRAAEKRGKAGPSATKTSKKR